MKKQSCEKQDQMELADKTQIAIPREVQKLESESGKHKTIKLKHRTM